MHREDRRAAERPHRRGEATTLIMRRARRRMRSRLTTPACAPEMTPSTRRRSVSMRADSAWLDRAEWEEMHRLRCRRVLPFATPWPAARRRWAVAEWCRAHPLRLLRPLPWPPVRRVLLALLVLLDRPDRQDHPVRLDRPVPLALRWRLALPLPRAARSPPSRSSNRCAR